MHRGLLRIFAFTLLAATLHTAPAALSLKWNELSGTIPYKQVIVGLKDGSTVKGEVGSVESSTLEVYVVKKGPVSIPRDSIASLRLIVKGKAGRRWGLAGGVLLGLVGSIALVLDAGDNHSGEVALAAAVMVGTPWAGYAVGEKLERSHEIRITILPDELKLTHYPLNP